VTAAWSVSTPWATPTTSWSGASLGGDEPIPRNATRTATVAQRTTSTVSLAGYATSSATVAAFATSTPGVSDG
jgi:hypothetical protein